MRTCLLLAVIAVVVAAPPAQADASREEQRQAFRDAYAEAERGNWATAERHRDRLENYVLWPDLRAAWLRATLRSGAHAAEITAFLERHAALKPARELRYRYALELGRQQRFDAYLGLYREHYAELGVARLDCLALQAELARSSAADIAARAYPLWLVGHSQADECDPVFDALRAAGLLDDAQYRHRFELAINARELSMARYLARSLPPAFGEEAAAWTRAYGNPERFLAAHDPGRDSPLYRRQLTAALTQLAYRQPEQAAERWRDLSQAYAFDAETRADIARHTVLWLARNHVSGAYAALLGLDDAAVDDEVQRWRVRTALRLGRMDHVPDLIDAMAPAERDKPQWQYWYAIATLATSPDTARQALATIAGERSYYGFLAADALGNDYAWQHEPLAEDAAAQARLAALPALQRARELFEVGLDGRGRSEWDAATRTLPAADQLQAALLAHRWGWHSRAIATAARHERYDDLDIRYPTPHFDAFSRYAAAAQIRPSWALGVARSESLFMSDIRSGAGAIGVMQLTPSTGRATARELGEPYTGYKTLTDPERNIRLGTWFLGSMQQRFRDNPVLATAAYNAGATRVDDWLPRGGTLDARIWIETIPYAETRDYVRRVLTADTIFHWRLAGETDRLSARLIDVHAAPAQLASR